jgi:protease-4
VIAASDFYWRNCYLAAHASRSISTQWAGAADRVRIYQNYYKSALDKLQIQFHVFRVGSYKSRWAVHAQRHVGLRSEASSALGCIVDSLQERRFGQRGVNPASVDDYVNHFPSGWLIRGDTAQMAVSYGLVDEIKTTDQVQEELVGSPAKIFKRSYNQVRSTNT